MSDSAHQPRREDLKREFASLLALPDFFVQGDVFSYPNWKKITDIIRERILTMEHVPAMNAVLFQWLENFCKELGEEYHFQEQGKFILLSNLKPDGVDQTLRFLEKAVDAIRTMLGECAWREAVGYEVVMFFDDDEDYFDYIAYYHREGTHIASMGIFIKANYTHIALPLLTGALPGEVLLHELAHSALCRYNLPLWLNEGIAATCQRQYNPYNTHFLQTETVIQHQEYWNEQTIQGFWAGTSFKTPGIASQLSYSLAPIVFHWLQEKKNAMSDFIREARPDDAGQTAALDCLGICLGKAAGNFLGEGDWRPKRKAMVECWQRYEAEHKLPAAT
jgi:hypothetical protein